MVVEELWRLKLSLDLSFIISFLCYLFFSNVMTIEIKVVFMTKPNRPVIIVHFS